MLRRAAVLAAGLAMTASVGLAGAGAASGVSFSGGAVSCTHLVGSVALDHATLRGCSVAATGGTGTIVNFTAGGGDVTWANGTTTDYTDASTTGTGCAAPSSELIFHGAVNSSTNPSTPVGQTVKMKVCVTFGQVKNLKGTTVKF
jgi:hypothetical protein